MKRPYGRLQARVNGVLLSGLVPDQNIVAVETLALDHGIVFGLPVKAISRDKPDDSLILKTPAAFGFVALGF
jgi:hypothetical protein